MPKKTRNADVVGHIKLVGRREFEGGSLEQVLLSVREGRDLVPAEDALDVAIVHDGKRKPFLAPLIYMCNPHIPGDQAVLFYRDGDYVFSSYALCPPMTVI